METITIQRVPYGKKKTLPEERDYYLKDKGLNSPAGNLAEWIAWAKELKNITVKKIRIIDKIMGEDYVVEL